MSTKNVCEIGLVLSRTYFVTSPDVNTKSEEMWRAFGGWLQRTREKVGMTQEQLAVKAEIHPKTISRIENGEPTKRTTVIKLAAALHQRPETALQQAGFAVVNHPALEDVDGEFAALFYESANWSEENRSEALEMAKVIYKRFREKEKGLK